MKYLDSILGKTIVMALLVFMASGEIFAGDHSIAIKKTTEKITLDGRLSEQTWQEADSAKDFFQQYPFDTTWSITKTVAKLTYDDHFLYVAAICYDNDPGNYVVQSLKRDFSYPVTDAFAIFIDPFSDKTNGFSFAVSPYGVQREGTLENGGSFGVSTSWDNRWFSAVERYPDRWEVEMAIPFKTLRYPEDATQWRVNFSRNNLKLNENSSWVPVPRNFNVATLAFTGEMNWDQAPGKAGTNVSLIPYALGRYDADYENGTSTVRPNTGADAKVAVTSALNLDLTVNPDFSQVEVDRQQTNLSRFSLFYPEKRQFFIENSDLFGNFGFSKIRPFFSRQIGLSNGQPVPILAGARLSGKLTPKWRVGLMNMQTRRSDLLGLEPQNYTVAVFQRQVLKRSNIGGIFVNRQGFNPDNSVSGTDYNRVAGVDFNYYSENNKLRGKAFYHRSFSPNINNKQSTNAIWLMYSDKNLSLMYNHEWVDRNYMAEVGFVPRVGYFRLEPIAWYNFYPKRSRFIQSHGPKLYASWYWNNESWQNIEKQSSAGYTVTFRNTAVLEGGVENWYVFLNYPFDPSGSGAEPLADSTGYAWNNYKLSWNSDFRKKFNYSLFTSYGGYFSGTKVTAGGALNFRAQPWGVFSVSFEQNQIVLPDTVVSLTLIGPNVELSFSKSLFFSSFFQYNTQTHNFNINARLQWRFKPMSDLFLVVTDNYLTNNMAIRNRAIVLKLNYWFSL